MHMHAIDSIVFIVNADNAHRNELARIATGAGFNSVAFEFAAEYLAYPKPDLPSCHIFDLNLSDTNGFSLQESVAPTDAVVCVAERPDMSALAGAFKAGAIDFVMLPIDEESLLRAINCALRIASERRAEQEKANALRRQWDALSRREREVLQLIVSGCMNKQAASELGITEITVKSHRARIMAKMAASSFADLVRMATMLDVPLIGGRRGSHSRFSATPARSYARWEAGAVRASAAQNA